MMYDYFVAHNSISRIVHECCDAIYDECSGDVMHCPRTSTERKGVAAEFAGHGGLLEIGTPKWLRNKDCALNIITIHLWVQQHGKMI